MKEMFKKYRFISKERICKTMQWNDFNPANIYNIGGDLIFKTGYCQYAFVGIEDDNVGLIVVTGEDDTVTCKHDFKLNDIPMFIHHFRDARKIVPIFKITGIHTGEPLNCEPMCIPSGNYGGECIGFLIK